MVSTQSKIGKIFKFPSRSLACFLVLLLVFHSDAAFANLIGQDVMIHFQAAGLMFIHS